MTRCRHVVLLLLLSTAASSVNDTTSSATGQQYGPGHCEEHAVSVSLRRQEPVPVPASAGSGDLPKVLGRVSFSRPCVVSVDLVVNLAETDSRGPYRVCVALRHQYGRLPFVVPVI